VAHEKRTRLIMLRLAVDHLLWLILIVVNLKYIVDVSSRLLGKDRGSGLAVPLVKLHPMTVESMLGAPSFPAALLEVQSGLLL
jgi:hypothetical protein